jgi:uncharacterized protein YjbI with pentapeptide repeats
MSSFRNPTNNNLNIANSVKQIFISQKNTGYLFDLIVSKILKSKPQYQPVLFNYINKYKENIIQLQDLLFNDSFLKIYQKTESSGNIDFEEILIELNKLTVLKFEQMLVNDLADKFTQNNVETSSQSNLQQSNLQQSNLQQSNLQQSNLQQSNLQQSNLQQSQPRFQSQPQQTTMSNQMYYANSYKEDDISVTSFTSEDKSTLLSTEFFSGNAVFEDGKYTFLLKTDDISGINIDNIKIKYNLYNITEHNNKFVLIESGVKTDVFIPIGYYDISTLIDMISDCTNDASVNRNKDYFYKVFLNTFKNKICFLCDYVNKEQVTKPISFGISFYKSKNTNIINLYEMLGFYKTNYINNNLYVAEDFANTNIFDEIYCKLYLDNMELPKYTTSNLNFCFFEKINTDMDKSFGKTISTQFNDDFYTFDNILKAKNLSLKFYNNYNSQITSPMWFKCKISFECI